ncbi:MAG: hypothetical protein KW788_04070 [Candidatus Doudnabacteria bacterium]|nr:hypothetical protein [Candidatus Doudnabacteria bacterium]
MKTRLRSAFFVYLLVILAVAAPRPVYAQKWLKKLGIEVQKDNKDTSTPTAPAAPTNLTSDKAPGTEQDPVATPGRNQPATFTVNMSPLAACKAVSKYFVNNDVEMKSTDCDAGQITSAAKVGTLSSKRVIVNFVDAGSNAEVRVRVMKMGNSSNPFSTNGGKNSEERKEGLDTKESAKLATSIRDHLLAIRTQATR